MTLDEIHAKGMQLAQAYPEDIEPRLLDELIQFPRNPVVYNHTMFGPLTDDEDNLERTLYRAVTQLNLRNVFPNVEISLCIYLSRMVTNATGERSFSKLLKRIKNCCRSASG